MYKLLIIVLQLILIISFPDQMRFQTNIQWKKWI